MEAWNTNLGHFATAGGRAPAQDQQRLSFISFLPPDVSAYVSMHLDLPEYDTYTKLRAFALKCAKLLQSLAATRTKSTYLVEQQSVEPAEGDLDEGEFENYEGFEGLEVDQRVDVLAFMRARGSQRTGRGRRSRAGRFRAPSRCRCRASSPPPR